MDIESSFFLSQSKKVMNSFQLESIKEIIFKEFKSYRTFELFFSAIHKTSEFIYILFSNLLKYLQLISFIFIRL